MTMTDATFLECFDTRSRVLPMLPQDRPQTANDPIVDGAKPGSYFSMAEIIPPAYGVAVESLNYLLDAHTATAAGQFTNSLFETLDRFGVDADARIITTAGEAEAQVGLPPGMTDAALLLVHL